MDNVDNIEGLRELPSEFPSGLVLCSCLLIVVLFFLKKKKQY